MFCFSHLDKVANKISDWRHGLWFSNTPNSCRGGDWLDSAEERGETVTKGLILGYFSFSTAYFSIIHYDRWKTEWEDCWFQRVETRSTLPFSLYLNRWLQSRKWPKLIKLTLLTFNTQMTHCFLATFKEYILNLYWKDEGTIVKKEKENEWHPNFLDYNKYRARASASIQCLR